MFERIIPVVIALIALQFLVRYMNKKRMNKRNSSRDFDYKNKIDQFLRISNYDEGTNNERILTDEIRSGLAKPELMLEIPDSMRDVRKGLNLIIDGVTHAVKGKISSRPGADNKYKNTAEMFDEIVEVIKKHKI